MSVLAMGAEQPLATGTGVREQWRLGRRPGLDALRGVSILLVLASHLFESRYLVGGAVGVTLFFGLSGFLITALLVEQAQARGTMRLGAFYARRARRLLPAATVMVVAVAVVEALEGKRWLGACLSVLCYFSNWLAASSYPMELLSHTWSLAIEEQFYLLWPPLLVLALRRGMTSAHLALACLSVAAASIGWRLACWYGGVSEARIYAGTDTRCDALLVGCALALALHAGWRPPAVLHRVGSWAIAGLVALGLYAGGFAHSVVAPTVTAVVLVPVLLAALEPREWFAGAPLRWLGSRSYAIYLWHVPLMYGLQWYVDPSWWSKLCGLLATLVAAELSWRLVERRFLVRRAEVVS